MDISAGNDIARTFWLEMTPYGRFADKTRKEISVTYNVHADDEVFQKKKTQKHV